MNRKCWGVLLLTVGIILVFTCGPAVGGPISAVGFWKVIGLTK